MAVSGTQQSGAALYWKHFQPDLSSVVIPLASLMAVPSALSPVNSWTRSCICNKFGRRLCSSKSCMPRGLSWWLGEQRRDGRVFVECFWIWVRVDGLRCIFAAETRQDLWLAVFFIREYMLTGVLCWVLCCFNCQTYAQSSSRTQLGMRAH